MLALFVHVLEFLVRLFKPRSLWTTAHSKCYSRVAHFCCADCTACSSLRRPFSEYPPSHTYGTLPCYGCFACPHGTVLRFLVGLLQDYIAESNHPFLGGTTSSCTALGPLCSFSVGKAFTIRSSALRSLWTIWGTVPP